MRIATRVWLPIGVVALVGAAVGFAFALKQAAGEDLTKAVGLDQRLNAQVPLDASFQDSDGKTVALGDLVKRPTVLMLVFYRCVDVSGTCFLEMEGAIKAFRSMKKDTIGKDFDVVTLSIHPKETPELAAAKKTQFLKQYGRPEAEQGWRFLTGTDDQIKRVADSVGFKYRYNAEKDQILHPAGLVILTPEGKVARYFYGADYPAKVLRDSLVAAGNGVVGERSVPILLGCFMYDETTGKTRLHVKNALKLTGGTTVFILGLSIFLMTRRPRRGEGA